MIIYHIRIDIKNPNKHGHFKGEFSGQKVMYILLKFFKKDLFNFIYMSALSLS